MRTDDSSVELEPAPDGFRDGMETYDPEQAMRPKAHSFVRICLDDPYEEDPVYAVEPPTLPSTRAPHRALLANDQLNFTVNLLHLTRLLQGGPTGMLTEAAATKIADRLGDLEDVRDAIDAVLAVRDPFLERLLVQGAALSVYLKGVYAYGEGLSEAFEEALSGFASIDGPALRFRLAESSQFYFDGLIHAVRFELSLEDSSAEARAATEQLFFAATFLHEQILSAVR
jgi:hypothetical protein